VDGDRKGEGNIPSFSCSVIDTFGGPIVFQWGGMIQEDLGMLTEVQKDLEHPKRSIMVQKFSKLKCFKSSQKFHQFIEL
jgi:hypothetical protein